MLPEPIIIPSSSQECLAFLYETFGSQKHPDGSVVYDWVEIFNWNSADQEYKQAIFDKFMASKHPWMMVRGSFGPMEARRMIFIKDEKVAVEFKLRFG
jgi:hypothetical protein